MSSMRIRARGGEWIAELDSSDISNEIWLSLPFSSETNMLGSQIYFEMHTGTKVKGDTTVFEKGDVVYWPNANALSFLFGPTPLSGDDGKPVSPYPMKKIGKLVGNCSDMENIGDRTKITLERVFN